MLKMPEILAPCGSIETFHAAVNAGCDAVYLAGHMFGARAYAKNFSEEELLFAISHAHIYGVKVYLTINTLYTDRETEVLIDYLKPLYQAGLDAVIIQDMGAFCVVKNEFPDLPIHASTQMNICSYKGAGMVKKLGATRVVPARELSLREIKEIKEKVDIEVECFVHGAMCFAYSGRCLMSSMYGGRSGNRGKCAQPCRLKYDSGHVMSMKDMCTVTDIPELIDAGIDSFKIEGRMKNEYYVASAVDAYKTLSLDYINGSFSPDKALRYKERLREVFNRGGFSGGYYKMHDGKEMLDTVMPGRLGVKVADISASSKGKIEVKALMDIGRGDSLEVRHKKDEMHFSDDRADRTGDIIKLTSGIDIKKGKTASLNAPRTKDIKPGDMLFRTRNAALMDEIDEKLIKRTRKIPVNAFLYAKTGDAISLTLSCSHNFVSGESFSEKTDLADTFYASVTGDILEKSNGKSLLSDEIKSKLSKLGNTPFFLGNIECSIQDEPFINLSELNRLRRECAAGLIDNIVDSYRRKSLEEKPEKTDNEADHKVLNNGTSNYDHQSLERYILISTKDQLLAYTDNFDLNDKREDNEETLHDHQRNYENVILDHRLFEFSYDSSDDVTKLIKRIHKESTVYIASPLITRNDNDYFSSLPELVKKLFKDGLIDGVYIRNHDFLAEFLLMTKAQDEKDALKVILANSLYITNKSAYDMYKEILNGTAYRFVMSEELTHNSFDLLRSYEGKGILKIYGRTVLMISANHIKGKVNKDFIIDEPHLCYNMLLSRKPVDFIDSKDACSFKSVFVELTNESYKETDSILKRYKNA